MIAPKLPCEAERLRPDVQILVELYSDSKSAPSEVRGLEAKVPDQHRWAGIRRNNFRPWKPCETHKDPGGLSGKSGVKSGGRIGFVEDAGILRVER